MPTPPRQDAVPSAAAPEPPSVGAALLALRQRQGLSLDALSRKAGVSKSMLSQIERDQANPTVAVVWRLALSLGVPVGDLLGEPRRAAPAIETVGAHGTPLIHSPDGKCALRILGPVELAGQFEWYELTVQGGGVLASEAHSEGAREHLSVLSGSLEVRSGDDTRLVRTGETARYAVDGAHTIRNPARGEARALLVVLHR